MQGWVLAPVRLSRNTNRTPSPLLSVLPPGFVQRHWLQSSEVKPGDGGGGWGSRVPLTVPCALQSREVRAEAEEGLFIEPRKLLDFSN